MLKNIIGPYQAAVLTSEWLLSAKNNYHEIKRKLTRAPHQVTFYYSIFDPYSHITAQLLPDLVNNFAVELSIIIVGATNNIEQPQHLNHAIGDCQVLSLHHHLNDFSQAAVPSTASFFQANQQLLNANLTLSTLIDIGQQLWCHPTTLSMAIEYSQLSTEEVNLALKENTQQLFDHGHYQSAMLHYGGHWYWSIDRIDLLASYLQELGACIGNNHLMAINTQPEFTLHNNAKTSIIDLYVSFRSPYSYIALVRLTDIAKRRNLTVNIKLMLPMVMRGMAVSTAKKMYILNDATRIARRYNIPFGKICDPLGDGIFDCINLFYYAKSLGKSDLFIHAIMAGIWSQGLNINDPKQLKKAVQALDINWKAAKQVMEKDEGIKQATINKDSLHALGLWGVPSFHTQTQTFWGQDRLNFLHEISQ